MGRLKQNFYYTISRFLDIKNKTDKYVKIYAQHGYDYQQKIEAHTGKNQLYGRRLKTIEITSTLKIF